LKIIFWNIAKNPLLEELKLLIKHHQPNILVLAEIGNSPAEIVKAISSGEFQFNYNEDPICEKIFIFSQYADEWLPLVTSTLRFTVRAVQVPNYLAFNLLGIHYQSKMHWNFVDQAAFTVVANNIIEKFESQQQNQNTLLIGDFNMNPFEPGMIQATGFHGVLNKSVAIKKKRRIDGKDYPFFYNPMWSFFGDFGKGPVSGTYYKSYARPVNYFWNIYDQVLIRPSLIKYFNENDLQVISNFGEDLNLLKKSGLINKDISDHLPISCTIKKIEDGKK